MSSLWWRSRTAHCCLLARGRMSVVRSWFVHDSPSPLGTQRQRQPLPVKIFEKKTDYLPGPPPGRERCTYPLLKQFPLSLGCPSRGLLLLCLPPVYGGQDGWRQQLPAEAGSVRSPQSAPVQPGTAGPGYWLRRRRGQSGIQEPWGTDFVGVRMSTRHSQRWRSWTTSVDIARSRYRAITFVARGARSGAVRSSSQNFRIVTTPVHVQTRRVTTGPEEEARFALPGGDSIGTHLHRNWPLHRGDPRNL